MNDLTHPFEESLSLDKTITTFYDDLIDNTRSFQLKKEEVSKAALRNIPIPFMQLVQLNTELNTHHDMLKNSWESVQREVQQVLEQAWRMFDRQMLSPQTLSLLQQIMRRHLEAVLALKVNDRTLNPISAALSKTGDTLARIPNVFAPIEMNPFAELEDTLSELLDAVRALEEKDNKTHTAKSSARLSDNLELGLSSLRHLGILPRTFDDTLPLIRLHIKKIYDDLEPISDDALWVNDVMNALTVQTIHLRDNPSSTSDAHEHFYAFFEWVQSFTHAALNYTSYSGQEQIELKQRLRERAHRLMICDEAQEDIYLAIERMHTGSKTTHSRIQTTLTCLYETLMQSGWLSPAYCEVWVNCRKRLWEAQRHLARSMQKRMDDIETVLMDISKAHETAFLQLFHQLPDGNAKTWLLEQQEVLKNILLNTSIQTFSHTTIETWEGRYRHFWINFSHELNKKRMTSFSFYGNREGFDQVRKNLKNSLQHLSDKGEMLFKFGEVHRDALINLLEEAWNNAYRLSFARNLHRETEFEALKEKLKKSQSDIEALHHLSQSMLIIQSHHAQTSLAHNIQAWQKPSRAAMAIHFVRQESIRLNLLPSFNTLPFEPVITCIQLEMDTYFASFWCSNRAEQKEVFDVIQAVLIERGKLLNDTNYTQEEAECAVLKRLHQQYLCAKEAHDNNPFTQLMRSMGLEWRSACVNAWKNVYEKHQGNLNNFKQEHEPAILIKLNILLLQFKEKTRLFGKFTGFEEDKQSALELLQALIRAIKAKGYAKETVSFLFSKTLASLEQLRFNEFSQALHSAYHNLKEREHLKDIDLKSDLEEAMGQDIQEVQDYYNKVKVLANNHHATLKSKRS